MKRLGWLALLALSQTAWAGSLQDCQQDAASAGCSAYLNGVVDSALMLGDKQAKAQFGETFAERALSSRAGERVKQSISVTAGSGCRIRPASRPICRRSSTRTRLTRSATCMTFWRLNSVATGVRAAREPHRMSHLTTITSTIFG